MGIIAWIKKHILGEKAPVTTVTSIKKAVAVKDVQPELDLSEWKMSDRTSFKKFIIAQQNIKRRKESSYKYSKFFKHRQPTTARKLWKPDKKPED